MTEQRQQQHEGRAVTLAGRLLRNRRFVRAPIALYRAHLGFLFGHRLLMLEHRGRVSGLPRHVVLEVVDRPAPDEYVVAAGFGMRAQWLRNVLHDPQVRVTTGWHGPRPGRAELLDAGEAAHALQRYASRHPRAWQRLKPVFEETLDAPITTDGTSLPMVRLTVSHGSPSAR